MKRLHYAGALALGLLAVAPPGPVSAQTAAVNPTPFASSNFWTPERMATAKPMPLGGVSEQKLEAARAAPKGPTGPQQSAKGTEPTVSAPPVNVPLFTPKPGSKPDVSGGIQPNRNSSYGAFFTTSRVFPDVASATYPNSAIGKLFFRDPRLPAGQNTFICSASVIRQRVVVTAGHCVFHPAAGTANDYYYDQFLFVPSYRQGVAPFKAWNWAYALTTGVWAQSDGTFPNDADVAMIEMVDQPYPTASSPVLRIAQITGALGYLTNGLWEQSITQVGYPANLDGGERMEITWAESFAKLANSVTIGSIMRGGSSGGPWIKDYGINPVDNDTSHPAASMNQLVSVTSYGPVALEPSYSGGSILGQPFLNVLNVLCGHRAGNC